MRFGEKYLGNIGLLTGMLIMLAAPTPLAAQVPATTESLVNQLAGLETTPDLNVAALRQQALERVKSKVDAAPLKRPPVVVQMRRRGPLSR
jgi:hypothetical protein